MTNSDETNPDFDAAVALTSDASGTDDSMLWNGHMTSDWSIGPVPNGGYTGAIITNALRNHSGAAIPTSLTTHYYRPTIPDTPCTVRTEVLRRGRTTTHADATLVQDGKVRARSVAVLGNYPSGEVHLPIAPGPIEPAESCAPRDAKSQGLHMTLVDSLDVRLDPTLNEAQPLDGPGAVINGWVRFRDGRPNDVLALILFADTFPPAALMAIPTAGWVPTIELTTHIRAEAAPGWIRGQVTTANIHDGTLIEDVRLWDSTGTLVVEARQLALLRTRG